MTPDARLLRIAAAQHGVITRNDAARAGLSNSQMRRRVASGSWTRPARSVFTVTGAPPTDHQRLLVAVRATGGVAGMASAAWLHRLDERPPARPTVVRASPGPTRFDAARLRRSADLSPHDVTTVASIPVTTATRTVLDLAATRSDTDLHRLIDTARRRGLTHIDPLVARFVDLARRGRPGVARMRRVLAEIDADVALLESDLESVLLAAVRESGLPMPVRQHGVIVGDAAYRIDLAYPDQRVAIEGDGFEFHARRDRFEDDRDRQNALVLSGWTVLRFTWRQIVRAPELVVSQIATALDSARTSTRR